MLALFILLVMPAAASAQSLPLRLIVDRAGRSSTIADGAAVVDDQVLVFIRPLAEALGGTAQWIAATKEALFTTDRTVAVLNSASGQAMVNGEARELAMGLVMHQGRLALGVGDLGLLGLTAVSDKEAGSVRVYPHRSVLSVSADSSSGNVRVVMSGDKPFTFNAFNLVSPNRLVIDVYDAVVLTEVAPIEVGHGGVVRVRAAMNRPGVTRIVAELETPLGYSLQYSDEGGHTLEVRFNTSIEGIRLDESSAIPRLLMASSAPISHFNLEQDENGVFSLDISGASLVSDIAQVEPVGPVIDAVHMVQLDADTARIRMSLSSGRKPLVRQADTGDSGMVIDFPLELAQVGSRKEEGSFVVELAFSGPVAANAIRLREPHRIAVDVPGVWAAGMEPVEMGGSGVARVRVAQFSSDTARVVLDLEGDLQYVIETPAPDRLDVRVITSSLWGKRIMLDPGHGGSDPGVVRNGLNEKDLTLDMALKLRDMLNEAGATVIMTRDTDKTVDLLARSRTANALAPDVFVSIHCNGVDDVFPGGTETFYCNVAPYSQQLAALIHTYLVREIGLLDRKVRQGDYHVIRETQMPSSLVEVAFLSNSYEHSRLRDPAFRQQAAAGIFTGIAAYFASDTYKQWAAQPR